MTLYDRIMGNKIKVTVPLISKIQGLLVLSASIPTEYMNRVHGAETIWIYELKKMEMNKLISEIQELLDVDRGNKSATIPLRRKKMNELISKIQEWLDVDRNNRSASIPIEYMIRVPETPKIWIYDLAVMEGKSITCLSDMENLNFKQKKRERLLAELAILDA